MSKGLPAIQSSTCHTIFHRFSTSMVKHFFHDFISIPEVANLGRVIDVYKMLGFNGCFGSIDCTHIFWTRSPKRWTNYCIGKENALRCLFK